MVDSYPAPSGMAYDLTEGGEVEEQDSEDNVLRIMAWAPDIRFPDILGTSGFLEDSPINPVRLGIYTPRGTLSLHRITVKGLYWSLWSPEEPGIWG